MIHEDGVDTWDPTVWENHDVETEFDETLTQDIVVDAKTYFDGDHANFPMTCTLEDASMDAPHECIPGEAPWYGSLSNNGASGIDLIWSVKVKKFTSLPKSMNYKMCLKCTNGDPSPTTLTLKINVNYIYCEGTVGLVATPPAPAYPTEIYWDYN